MKFKYFTILIGYALLAILPVSAQVTFEKHQISTIGRPMDVSVFDINGDGLKDLATVATTSGEVAWWENNGHTGFSKHTIKTGFDGGRSIRAGDLNGDGNIDLVAASITLNSIEWFENNGSSVFTTHVLDGNFRGAHTVQVVDLDQDGDQDVICSGWDNTPTLSEVAWWENTGSAQFLKHVISNTLDQAPFVDAADMDGDGDLDLIGSDETSGEVYWWANNGSQLFTQYLIDNQFSLAHTVVARDLDKDGDPDILGAACTSGLQAWYENKGSGVFVKHVMENLGGAIWLDAGDFDLDGDLDMIATGMTANQLAFYDNSGKQQFSHSWVTGDLSSGFALQVADMDDDGDPDVVAIGYNSNFMGWWENTTSRLSLMQAPGWITRGITEGCFLVVNSERGNLLKTNDLEPVCGIVNPGYCQAVVCSGGQVYAAVGSEIVVYDEGTGLRVTSYRTDVQFLEGITADGAGNIFASAPWDGKIILLDPSVGEISDLASGLAYPRGVKYDASSGEILILDGEESITIKAADRLTGEIRVVTATSILPGGDIEPDQAGNYYISSPVENTLYAWIPSGSGDVFTYRDNLDGPWGLCYDPNHKELVVAMNSGNRLERISAGVTSINVRESYSLPAFGVYPNPFTDRLNLIFPDSVPEGAVFQLVASDGRIVSSRKFRMDQRDGNTGHVTMNFQNSGMMPAGWYFLRWYGSAGEKSVPVYHSER